MLIQNEKNAVHEFMRSFDSELSLSGFENVDHEAVPVALKKIFSNNTPFSLQVDNVYHQAPEINIIEEQTKEGVYLRKQTTEILTDNFCFSPIVFSYIKIDQSTPSLINSKELMPIENTLSKYGKKAHWTIKQIIKVNDWKEPVHYLGKNIYGKLATLSVDEKNIAEVLEFISLEPNKEAGTTIYEEINQLLLSPSDPTRNLENVLQHIKGALEITPKNVLDAYFPQLNDQVKREIENKVDGVEHIAVLVPFETSIEGLDHIATKVGFPDNHQTVKSVIVAKELGLLAGKNEVSTLVFKAWGHNSQHKTIGLEVFIPREKNPLEHDWIEQGVTTHISLRIKTLDDLSQIREILLGKQIEMAKFLNGKLILENEAYFDTFINGKKFRIEFAYKQ